MITGCGKVQRNTDIFEKNSVKTSVRYFIMSERQDAFDQLRNGVVKSVALNKVEIVFELNAERIKDLDNFKTGDLVRVFYGKGLMPITAYNIIPINTRGEAHTEQELFKINHYIEGRLDGTDKRKMKVLFDVVDGLTYMPDAISSNDVVDVFYSQGLHKAPLARRIIKHIGTQSNSLDNKTESLRNRILERFERDWFELGGQLWIKIAHSNKRFDWEEEEIKKLFDSVTDKASKDLNITKEEVLEVINKKEYKSF